MCREWPTKESAAVPSDWNVLTIAAAWHSQRSGPGNQAERRSLSDRVDGRETLLGNQAVVGDGFVANEVPIGDAGCDCRGAGSHERIEDDFVAVGVQLDEALGQLDGERCGVTDASCGLGSDVPDRQGVAHERFFADRALTAHNSTHPTFGEDQDVFVEISHDRIGWRSPRTPRA